MVLDGLVGCGLTSSCLCFIYLVYIIYKYIFNVFSHQAFADLKVLKMGFATVISNFFMIFL